MPAQFDVGRVRMPLERFGGLLFSDDVPADLKVELLPAMRWMYEAEGYPTNLCISAAITLHHAYDCLGIVARPQAVDLVVSDQRTGQMIHYGRPDPGWDDDGSFLGHCVLHLPGSRRFIDPTVEQYPEVRRFRLGPICGRLAAARATPPQLAAIARGELPPGTHVGVQREHLLLMYTAVDAEYADVVTNSNVVRVHEAEFRRSGRNLAATCIELLRMPECVDHVRQAPYPQLHALLDAVGDAPTQLDDQQDLRFAVPGFTAHPLGARIDELRTAVAPPARPTIVERVRNLLQP